MGLMHIPSTAFEDEGSDQLFNGVLYLVVSGGHSTIDDHVNSLFNGVRW